MACEILDFDFSFVNLEEWTPITTSYGCNTKFIILICIASYKLALINLFEFLLQLV